MMTKSSLLLASLLAASLIGGCATADDDLDLADTSEEATTRAHFEMWNTDGQWFFHVESGNGAVMLTSEGYTTRTGALNGILAVLDYGALESRYSVATGADKQKYVRLTASNGQIIATTDGYSTLSNAKRAIRSISRSVGLYVEAWYDNQGARFEAFEGADRQFYFNLYAKNGAIVLRSEGYKTEAAALNGAFATAQYGVNKAYYTVKAAASGGFYVNLRAPNNEVVATSEVYSTKTAAERARNAIIALLPSIELL